MDTRAGLLISGGTVAAVALAVTCSLMLGNAAALSNQPGRALGGSTVTVPARAATPMPVAAGPAPVVAPEGAGPQPSAPPAPPAPSAPPVQPSPAAPPAPETAPPAAVTVPAPPAQTIDNGEASHHDASARSHGEWARLRAVARHAAAEWEDAAHRLRAEYPDMKAPAPRAGHWSGSEHPRAGSGSYGR